MSKTKIEIIQPESRTAQAIRRVIFTMGGKGGVGKTGIVLALTDWFRSNGIPITLLDLDTENKARGSLQHYFAEARKVDIQTHEGLDALIDSIDDGAEIVLADMGAGSGQVTYQWFDAMHEDLAETGVVFTAIGVVTPDPASVESVLSWANRLQDRVQYVVVENSITQPADFHYWRNAEQAQRFRDAFHPAIIPAEHRSAKIENPARQHGVTLGQIAGKKTDLPEFHRTIPSARAQGYLRRLCDSFDSIKEFFLP
ncbi:MAG TPA: hypothetical protein VLY24_13320 [Bryobacteraceae bacterium]|nr:hypothetical protein [Bryobacteraceae bacterium]